MNRFACVAAVCLVATLGVGVIPAQAQVAPPPADPKLYAELTFGPTLGHKGDKFIGAEAGFRLRKSLYVFVEGSHLGNVATTDLDDRAAIIANFLGGNATTAFKVNFGAVGARYVFDLTPSLFHPYVLGAVGAASVKTEVEFNVNGTTIDPASRGVQLGGDLSGTNTKTIVIVGFGVTVPFKTRFFGDLGYRYGQILAKTQNFETDKAIPTQRVLLGVGVRF